VELYLCFSQQEGLSRHNLWNRTLFSIRIKHQSWVLSNKTKLNWKEIHKRQRIFYSMEVQQFRHFKVKLFHRPLIILRSPLYPNIKARRHIAIPHLLIRGLLKISRIIFSRLSLISISHHPHCPSISSRLWLASTIMEGLRRPLIYWNPN
jgi:hypothetical protein